MKNNETKYNYGIDFLKTIAMLFIVSLHVLRHGGILSAVENQVSVDYMTIWILEIISMCGVNCFALASGYVGYHECNNIPRKYSQYIKYWIPVVLYCILFNSIGYFLKYDSFSINSIIKSFVPVTSYQYWYFSCYTGLFFFVPFINSFISNNSRKTHIVLSLVMFVFFSFYAIVARMFWNPFGVQDGYSFLWLISLYYYGGLAKKYHLEELRKRKGILLTCLICFAISVTWKIGLHITSIYTQTELLEKGSNLLILYISPTMLITSLCFLLICIQIHFGNRFCKIIHGISPLTFGVYLINDSYFVREIIFKKYIEKINGVFSLPTIIGVFILIIAVYLLCLFIEKMRTMIFKICKINALIDYITKITEKAFCKLLAKAGDENGENN